MTSSTPRIAFIAAAAFLAQTAMALNLGTNITIPDNISTSNSWEGNAHEDNETEPGTIHSQAWDLEAMYLNGTKLTLVGGYDFVNGAIANGHTYTGGDLFIDNTGSPAVYGSGAGAGTTLSSNTSKLFGYDYALDFNYTTKTFDIVKLGAGTLLRTPTDILDSVPWRYVSGGTVVQAGLGFDYGLLSSADVSAYGLLGDGSNNNHYYLTVDLSLVPDMFGSNATFHYTMECGNDNLMGRAQVPDAGATALMLGGVLVAMVGFRRKLRL